MDTEVRRVVVAFRVTELERQAIRDAAQMVKRPDSDVIRMATMAVCDELARQKAQAAPPKGEPEAPG